MFFGSPLIFYDVLILVRKVICQKGQCVKEIGSMVKFMNSLMPISIRPFAECLYKSRYYMLRI